MKRICTIALGLGVLGLAANTAKAVNVDFEGPANGSAIDFAGFGQGIFAVAAVNNGAGPDIATVSDTEKSASGDIKYTAGKGYAGGNLKTSRLRKVLIVPSSGSGLTPSSSGGQLTLTFFNPVKTFGFDVVDVDAADAPNTFITFRLEGQDVATIPFSEFKNTSSPYKRPTVVWGNNTANRIAPFTLQELGLDPSVDKGFDEVVFDFPSEMGFDNFNYRVNPVPEPAAASMLLSLPALLSLRRRRRK